MGKASRKNSAEVQGLYRNIEMLEEHLHSAFRQLGAELPVRPVRTSEDPLQLPMRMNWLRHDLDQLERLADKASRRGRNIGVRDTLHTLVKL